MKKLISVALVFAFCLPAFAGGKKETKKEIIARQQAQLEQTAKQLERAKRENDSLRRVSLEQSERFNQMFSKIDSLQKLSAALSSRVDEAFALVVKREQDKIEKAEQAKKGPFGPAYITTAQIGQVLKEYPQLKVWADNYFAQDVNFRILSAWRNDVKREEPNLDFDEYHLFKNYEVNYVLFGTTQTYSTPDIYLGKKLVRNRIKEDKGEW